MTGSTPSQVSRHDRARCGARSIDSSFLPYCAPLHVSTNKGGQRRQAGNLYAATHLPSAPARHRRAMSGHCSVAATRRRQRESLLLTGTGVSPRPRRVCERPAAPRPRGAQDSRERVRSQFLRINVPSPATVLQVARSAGGRACDFFSIKADRFARGASCVCPRP